MKRTLRVCLTVLAVALSVLGCKAADRVYPDISPAEYSASAADSAYSVDASSVTRPSAPAYPIEAVYDEYILDGDLVRVWQLAQIDIDGDDVDDTVTAHQEHAGRMDVELQLAKGTIKETYADIPLFENNKLLGCDITNDGIDDAVFVETGGEGTWGEINPVIFVYDGDNLRLIDDVPYAYRYEDYCSIEESGISVDVESFLTGSRYSFDKAALLESICDADEVRYFGVDIYITSCELVRMEDERWGLGMSGYLHLVFEPIAGAGEYAEALLVIEATAVYDETSWQVYNESIYIYTAD